jgi:hypothetical protein
MAGRYSAYIHRRQLTNNSVSLSSQIKVSFGSANAASCAANRAVNIKVSIAMTIKRFLPS